MRSVSKEDVCSYGVASKDTDLADKPSRQQVKSCLEFLAPHGKRKTINRNISSYGLKHAVERWLRSNGSDAYFCYVSNGALIMAALELGYDCVQCAHGSPNVFINIKTSVWKGI